MAVEPFHYGTPASGDFFTDVNKSSPPSRAGAQRHQRVVTAPRATERRRCSSVHAPSSPVLGLQSCESTSSSAPTCTLARSWRLKRTACGRHLAACPSRRPEFLRRFRVTPIITFDEAAIRRSSQPGPQRTASRRTGRDVYAILSSLSAKRPAALVLDEFQAVPELGPHLPSLLKALADEHHRCRSCCGLSPHLMEELVLNTGAPLYNMPSASPSAH